MSVVHLNRVIRKILIERVTTKPRAEGGKGVRHVEKPASQPQSYWHYALGNSLRKGLSSALQDDQQPRFYPLDASNMHRNSSCNNQKCLQKIVKRPLVKKKKITVESSWSGRSMASRVKKQNEIKIWLEWSTEGGSWGWGQRGDRNDLLGFS